MFTANTLFLFYFIFFLGKNHCRGPGHLVAATYGRWDQSWAGKGAGNSEILVYFPSPNQPNGRGNTVRCWKTPVIRNKIITNFPGKKEHLV